MEKYKSTLCLPLLCLTVMSVVSSTLTVAAQDPAKKVRPWIERAIPFHLQQRKLRGRLTLDQLKSIAAHGEKLFAAQFTVHDGFGRPGATQAIVPTRRKRPPESLFQRTSGSDAGSCAACHNRPKVGGAGDFAVNAFVSEGFVNADFDTVDPQFSNERNTNHLFGSGLIELLAREMTRDLHAHRRKALRDARQQGQPVRIALVSKGVRFGQFTAFPDGLVDLSQVDGVDDDLVIRPFSQKGVIVSLRQFTVNALNHHHGMQAIERFGPRWTGVSDFDKDGKAIEITRGDVSALVAWQATLPAPSRSRPASQAWRRAASRGELEFSKLGCAQCHRPSLPLKSTIFSDPGPFDSAGTLRDSDVPAVATYDLGELDWVKSLPRNAEGHVLVPLWGDLKRHRMTDRTLDQLGNELLAQRFVDRSIFQTAELWGIASTAPYGHRGDFTTLDGIIRAHGGAARKSRDNYVKLEEAERQTIIAFLKTLVISP